MSSTITDPETRIAPDPFDETTAPLAEAAATLAPPNDFDDVDKMSAKSWLVSGSLTYTRGDQTELRPFERTYVQEPLSYRGIVEFTGLLGRAIDEAMSGPSALDLGGVLNIAQFAQDFQDDDSRRAAISSLIASGDSGINGFVKGFAKLCAAVPSLIDESQCIWLRIPLHERFQAREVWNLPPSRGGLNGDDGELMMRVFIAQNYEELERFFGERLRRIFGTIQMARKRSHLDA
jgi:hypothetical protein